MKFDLHVHSHCSPDAGNSPKKLLELAKQKNMGFAITDHNTCSAWQELKKLNKKFNVPIIFGEEIKVFENDTYLGELLGYFLQRPLASNQSLEVLDELNQQDAMISLAHPFDYFRDPLFSNTKKLPFFKTKVHAVEVFNSRCYLNAFNRRAREFACKHKLAFTAGSDAHFPEEFGNAFVELEGSNEEEWRNSLKKCSNFSGKLSRKRVHLYTFLKKYNLRGF